MNGRREVTRLKQQLDAAFSRVSLLSTSDIELRSDFARYLCVLVSGYLEMAVQELAAECCRRQSSPMIHRFASSQLRSFQNPGREKVLQLMGSFNPGWRTYLESNFANELEAAGSVVSNRNLIAHGRSVSITYIRVRDYFDRVQRLVEQLSNWFDP